MKGFAVAVRKTSPAERQQADEKALGALRSWSAKAQKAFAENTQRAWSSDWYRFSYYCLRLRRSVLPADGETLARYVRYLGKRGLRPSTIRRHVSTIAKAHQAANCDNPAEHNDVELALREVSKQRSAQRQARGLVWKEIARYLERPPTCLRDYRDRALVLVAYDTLSRSNELVALDDGHISFTKHTVRFPYSKTDQKGKGRYCFLSDLAEDLLTQWIERAGIKEGALFRAIIGKNTLGERLKSEAVADIFRRIGKQIGLPEDEVKTLSGHSVRVGATQDQLAANIDSAAVAQSGRWKDSRMVLRYGAEILAQRSGAARLAALQGRVKRDRVSA